MSSPTTSPDEGRREGIACRRRVEQGHADIHVAAELPEIRADALGNPLRAEIGVRQDRIGRARLNRRVGQFDGLFGRGVAGVRDDGHVPRLVAGDRLAAQALFFGEAPELADQPADEKPLDVQVVDVMADVGPQTRLVDVVVLIEGVGDGGPDSLHVLLAVGACVRFLVCGHCSLLISCVTKTSSASVYHSSTPAGASSGAALSFTASFVPKPCR